MGVEIIIGGDFCVNPSYSSANLFSKEVIRLFGQSDINIINLECPVIEEGNKDKIIKTGPHLSTNYEIFEQLKRINIHTVTLANNHILDFGPKGLASTIKGCIQNNILTVGAGENMEAAATPTIIEQNGLRIALVNFCEHEFSIATTKTAGANPLDIIDNLKVIQSARRMADFVLVIVHGGHEFYNLPSPRMVKQYRFFAENGADAVIGHHPHCMSGYEIHNNKPIFYSLGNMIFTMKCDQKGWYNGLLVKLKLKKGTPLTWELLPVQQSTKNFHLSISGKEDHEKAWNEINSYSEIISDKDKLNQNWILFARRMESQILNDFSPVNIIPGRYLKAMVRRSGINKFIFHKRYLIPILNSIECESLKDLSNFVLKQKSEEL